MPRLPADTPFRETGAVGEVHDTTAPLRSGKRDELHTWVRITVPAQCQRPAQDRSVRWSAASATAAARSDSETGLRK